MCLLVYFNVPVRSYVRLFDVMQCGTGGRIGRAVPHQCRLFEEWHSRKRHCVFGEQWSPSRLYVFFLTGVSYGGA